MKPRILVVDDEPALRRTLERALGAMGYDVVSVGDPLLVYELLDAADYDLVILDIHLPQLSGDTLCHRPAPALAPAGRAADADDR